MGANIQQQPLPLLVDGAPIKAPLIVSYGAGVDSTAMLVGMHKQGLVPDLILFADTGAEKPETYAYLDTINAWCERVGFPVVTVVKYRPVSAPYDTLQGNCAANETLPSLAFGRSGCSNKFKSEVMDSWLLGKARGPWRDAGWPPLLLARAVGHRAIKFIGYDDSAADRRRTKRVEGREDPTFSYRYPLQEWGWTRPECIRQIAAAGLPVPLKSSCFFCPASKRWEIRWLAAVHPDLFLQAIAMEDAARDGKHGLRDGRGLGIGFRWREYAEEQGFLVGNSIVGDPEEMLAAVRAEMPPHEANVVTLQRPRR